MNETTHKQQRQEEQTIPKPPNPHSYRINAVPQSENVTKRTATI
jgi:hypothetical protein